MCNQYITEVSFCQYQFQRILFQFLTGLWRIEEFASLETLPIFAKMRGQAMINLMSQTTPISENKISKKAPLSIWKAIILLITLAFMAVALFGAIIYLFIRGAQQMGLPPVANIAIFVIISGIFAWLMKRITDIVSDMSERWFPEEVDPNYETDTDNIPGHV